MISSTITIEGHESTIPGRNSSAPEFRLVGGEHHGTPDTAGDYGKWEESFEGCNG